VNARNTQEPLSWFTLDRYHLGQLSTQEHESVESHLQICSESRARLDEVRKSIELKPLALKPVSASWLPQWTELWRPPRWVKMFSGATAATVAVLLGVLLKTAPEHEIPERFATKGGVITFTLIRQHGEDVSESPEVYEPEDTFMVAVTCPAGLHEDWNVLVFTDGEVNTPLASPVVPQCGNRVLLEGAFGVRSRSPVDICLVWGELGNPTYLAKHKITRAMLQGRAVCKTLKPLRR